MNKVIANKPSVVKLNIGGQLFVTSLSTLFSERDSIFTVMFNGCFDTTPDINQDEYFIDRDPTYFPLILKHLRGYDISDTITQHMNDLERKQLAEDVDFFQITSMHKFFPSFFSSTMDDMDYSGGYNQSEVNTISRVAVPLKNGSVKVYDLNSRQVMQTIPRKYFNGKQLVQCSDDRLVTADEHGSLYVWSCTTGQCMNTLVKDVHTESDVTKIFKISESLIASTRLGHTTKNNAGNVNIWNIYSGKCVHTIEHVGCVSKLTPMKQQNTFLLVSNKSIAVWEITNENVTQKFRATLQRKIRKKSVIEIADRKIAFLDERGLKIWDVDKFECLQSIDTTFKGRTIWPFSKMKIALVNETDITIFDIHSGRQVLSIKYNYCAVRLCSRTLATYNAEQQLIEIWDVVNAQKVKAFINQHNGAVSSILKLPDNRLVTSGGNTVNIWDVMREEEDRKLRSFNHSGSLIKLCDMSIASVKYYNHSLTVTVWDIEGGNSVYSIQESDYDYNCEIFTLA